MYDTPVSMRTKIKGIVNNLNTDLNYCIFQYMTIKVYWGLKYGNNNFWDLFRTGDNTMRLIEESLI